MAVSVMLYHLHGSCDDATKLICKLGIYAVVIFFILSGLSMALVYDRYIVDVRTSVAFYVRRVFRIWPLLWLVVACVWLMAWSAGNPFSWRFLLLNLTTAFGFLTPSHYMATGAWSIGNEMVYYALTPLLIPAFRRSLWLGNILTLAALAIFVLFTFRLMHANAPLASQWSVYVNPFNNVFYYCAGIAIYYHFHEVSVPTLWRLPLFFSAVAAFIFYPIVGNEIALVVGIHRLALATISIAIVFAFYKCAPPLPQVVSRALINLGVATYGVYLLHPIIAIWARRLFERFGIDSTVLVYAGVSIVTIGLARLLFRSLEMPFIRLGKRLTARTVSASLLPRDK